MLYAMGEAGCSCDLGQIVYDGFQQLARSSVVIWQAVYRSLALFFVDSGLFFDVPAVVLVHFDPVCFSKN